MAWPDLLHALFGGDVVRFLGRQRGMAADRDLTAEHIGHALRLIATRLGVRTLRPGQYEAARSDLLAAGARRHRHGQRISLPTAGQIERVAGNRDRALGLAALQPRTRETSTASPVS